MQLYVIPEVPKRAVVVGELSAEFGEVATTRWAYDARTFEFEHGPRTKKSR